MDIGQPHRFQPCHRPIARQSLTLGAIQPRADLGGEVGHYGVGARGVGRSRIGNGRGGDKAGDEASDKASALGEHEHR